MLEALVDPDTGDVIVVKPLGSPWGRCEVNAVVKLTDPGLETELAGRPHVVYPYAIYEETTRDIKDKDGNVIGTRKQRKIVESSAIRVKVDPAEIQKTESIKPGILVAVDADTPVAVAVVEEVKPDPIPDAGGVIVKPDRPLPTKK
jgi:hypothetical protein